MTPDHLRDAICEAIGSEPCDHYGADHEFVHAFPQWNGVTLSLGTGQSLQFSCHVGRKP